MAHSNRYIAYGLLFFLVVGSIITFWNQATGVPFFQSIGIIKQLEKKEPPAPVINVQPPVVNVHPIIQLPSEHKVPDGKKIEPKVLNDKKTEPKL